MNTALEIIAVALTIGAMGTWCVCAVIANLSKDMTEDEIESWLRRR